MFSENNKLKSLLLSIFLSFFGIVSSNYAHSTTPIYRIISCYKELPEGNVGDDLALRLFQVNLGPSDEILGASESLIDQKSLRPLSPSESLTIKSLNMEVNEIKITALSKPRDQFLYINLNFYITVPLIVKGKLQDVPHYKGMLRYSDTEAESVEYPVFCNVQHF